jgi:cell division septation protein DedD
MKDAQDSLEAELSALRPQPISDALRRRIAQRLAEPVPGPVAVPVPVPVRRQLLSGRRALAGSLAAACLAAVVWSWIGGQEIKTSPKSVKSQPAAVNVADPAAPMLLAYQRALARSPEQLDALLDRHAGMTPLRDSQFVRIGAFTRSDAALHTLLGDD